MKKSSFKFFILERNALSKTEIRFSEKIQQILYTTRLLKNPLFFEKNIFFKFSFKHKRR